MPNPPQTARRPNQTPSHRPPATPNPPKNHRQKPPPNPPQTARRPNQTPSHRPPAVVRGPMRASAGQRGERARQQVPRPSRQLRTAASGPMERPARNRRETARPAGRRPSGQCLARRCLAGRRLAGRPGLPGRLRVEAGAGREEPPRRPVRTTEQRRPRSRRLAVPVLRPPSRAAADDRATRFRPGRAVRLAPPPPRTGPAEQTAHHRSGKVAHLPPPPLTTDPAEQTTHHRPGGTFRRVGPTRDGPVARGRGLPVRSRVPEGREWQPGCRPGASPGPGWVLSRMNRTRVPRRLCLRTRSAGVGRSRRRTGSRRVPHPRPGEPVVAAAGHRLRAVPRRQGR